MQISTSPTREKYPLSFKKIIKKTLSSLALWVMGLAFLAGFALFLTFYLDAARAIQLEAARQILIATMSTILVFIILIAVPTYIYQRWYFAKYFYDLGKDYIVIRKGVITPSEISMPYERVQDVYMNQDILDRIFGLFDVHLSTATSSSGMEAHIDGLEKDAAMGLKEELLRIVGFRIQKSVSSSVSDHQSS